MTDDTHYEALGVEPNASRDEVRAAYRSRVESLESARERKDVSESALQANREETARVRAAWNVLSDPFQRQRYDARLEHGADDATDDPGDAGTGTAGTGNEVELTGWRKLLAPPPPKQGNGAGATGGKQPPPRRPAPQPTISLPPGTTLAETRLRGMALLFDISILLLLYIGIQYFVPQTIQSDYKNISDQITACKNVNDDASPAAKLTSDKKKCGYTADFVTQSKKQQEKQAGDRASKLQDDIRTTQYETLAIVFLAWMLYLVPSTARTGRTFGMRGRHIRVLRVNGQPCGWAPALLRFLVPCGLALAVPTLGPVLGLGVVIWAFRDPNHQGFHDKLAKTIVVNDPA
jgi:hypothetical protein